MKDPQSPDIYDGVNSLIKIGTTVEFTPTTTPIINLDITRIGKLGTKIKIAPKIPIISIIISKFFLEK